MRSSLSFKFLLLVFLIFSCLGAVSLGAHEVLYPAPGNHALARDYSRFSNGDEDDFDDRHKTYFVALSYLNGNDLLGMSRDPKKAAEYFAKAWDEGVVDAGYTLGLLYVKGSGVDEDVDKGKWFLESSASKGLLKSQQILADAYRGKALEGVFQPDPQEAIRWLRAAAESGSQQACVDLAAMYKDGHDVEKSQEKAFEWLKKAEGSIYQDGFSHLQMAAYYEKGIGTDKSLVQAYKYYDLSGSAGIKDKQRIAKEMTQEQIDEALRQSKKWQKEHNVQVGGGSIRRAN